MRLRFFGDDRPLIGKTALDCLRFHCNGDHSPEARRGDIDGVMARLAKTFELDTSYSTRPTLDERCIAFVDAALASGLLVDAKLSP